LPVLEYWIVPGSKHGAEIDASLGGWMMTSLPASTGASSPASRPGVAPEELAVPDEPELEAVAPESGSAFEGLDVEHPAEKAKRRTAAELGFIEP
jgi:hypothetical protein